MSAQKGKDLLIKIGDGASPEVFTTVAGLRATQLAFNATNVDVTNADSADQWRELLAGGGVKTATVTGSGVFKDAASDASLRAAFFAQSVGNFQIAIPSFGTVTGPFKIAALQYDGPYDGELKISLSLASAGALAFAAPRVPPPPLRGRGPAKRWRARPCDGPLRLASLSTSPATAGEERGIHYAQSHSRRSRAQRRSPPVSPSSHARRARRDRGRPRLGRPQPGRVAAEGGPRRRSGRRRGGAAARRRPRHRAGRSAAPALRSRHAGRRGDRRVRRRRTSRGPRALKQRSDSAWRRQPPFGWSDWLSFGLGRLRLSPQTFWSLSLPEWRALTAPKRAASPLARSEFDELMRRYPD